MDDLPTHLLTFGDGLASPLAKRVGTGQARVGRAAA
jgi:hypothetical protein